ncbi:pentatricopeptide repeat-containing protein At3g29230-like [Chenopodium quinoa]|nr:pentatricopeptide repeat-containing protein At3g29230-like [Chenopodium quinoa]
MAKLQPHTNFRPPMTTPIRAPTWFSTRRQLELKVSELHKCSNLSHLKQLHAQIFKANLHNDPFIAPKLISAFSLCHQLGLAINVFNQVQFPNVHLYNSLIRAQTQNSQSSQAFITFLDMLNNGVFPDNFTYPFLLKACSGPCSLQFVQMVHTQMIKLGFFGDIFVPNSLIDSYCKCGVIGVSSARKLFVFMEDRDIVSWNSLIRGLVKGGNLKDARQLFDEMPEKDAVSWNIMLDGYVKAKDMDAAFQLFEKMPERNVVSWSTMVSGYTKAGDLDMARLLFDKMPVKNLVSWTIIISGYAGNGFTKEAISLYNEMESLGLKFDDGTIISILAACAESGLLTLGKRVRSSIVATGFRCSVAVNNALIDMYVKCGCAEKALVVFQGMSERDLVSWNTIIQGLAMHGDGVTALKLFSRMKKSGFRPDKFTFIGILCACTHMGYVDKGLDYFYSMERDYDIVPQIEHYGCLVDLLGRGGRLKEALEVVQNMPMEPNAVIWGTLLGACRLHYPVEIAQEVLKHLVKVDPTEAGNFSMLSNIYAAAGDWGNVANVRRTMKNIGVQKPSGASTLDLDGEVHEFTVFDNSHPNSEGIYQMIHLLRPQLKESGCAPRPTYG